MSSIYLQLQNTTKTAAIAPGGTLLFDDTPLLSSADVMYVASSGVILLRNPGTYLVQWSVSLSEPAGSKIALTNQSDQVSVLGCGLVAPGQLSSTALVNVTADSLATLQLVNKSSLTVYPAKLDVMANLVIYSVTSDDSTGIQYPPTPGGTGKGSLSLSFSSAFGPTCYPAINASGVLTQVSIIGASQSSDLPAYLQVNRTVINIPFAADRLQYIYSFPYDVKLVSASAVFNNRTALMLYLPTTKISPFVGIGIQAIANTYTFNILEESKVYHETGYQMLQAPPQYITESTILTTVRTDLDVSIPAGTPFVIVGGLINLGLSLQALNAFIYMNGTMVFEIQ